MTENASPMTDGQPGRTITARPVGNHSVLSVIGAEAGQPGPYPFLCGVPNPAVELVGPPPEYLAVAAWAA